jgi:hypothetical protein
MYKYVAAFLGGVSLGACVGRLLCSNKISKNDKQNSAEHKNSELIVCSETEPLSSVDDVHEESEQHAVHVQHTTNEPSVLSSQNAPETPIDRYRDDEYDRLMQNNAIIIAVQNRSKRHKKQV